MNYVLLVPSFLNPNSRVKPMDNIIGMDFIYLSNFTGARGKGELLIAISFPLLPHSNFKRDHDYSSSLSTYPVICGTYLLASLALYASYNSSNCLYSRICW